MAHHDISPGHIAAHALTLAAGVEDVVTFHDRYQSQVAIIVHPGAVSPVYVTLGSAPASVGGAHCRVCFPGYAITLRAEDGPTTVRLISAGPAVYSVEAG